MPYTVTREPAAVALDRWLWSARWQLTRFAEDNYALYGRGITLIKTRTVPDVARGAESLIPRRKIAFHTVDAIRRMKPTRRVSAYDLQDWIDSTEGYDPPTQSVHAVIAGSLPTHVSIGPLITFASEATNRFLNALTIRPLALDVVRQAARVYHDELVAAGCTEPAIEAKAREAMCGYRYCFTHYDKAPLFGLHVATAIAEGFGISPARR